MSANADSPAGSASRSDARAKYVLAILTLVSVSNYMDRTVLSVLVEPIKKDLALHDWQLGLLTGFAFAAFYATLGLPIARLADRTNRTHVLSASLAVWSVMTAACGLAQNFIQLLLARFGVGSGEAGCVPASHSLIGHYFGRERRAVAISIFQAGGALGTMLGIMLAGALGERIGWRATFIVIGLPGLLLAVIMMLTTREPARDAAPVAQSRAGGGAFALYADLLRQRSYRHLVSGFALGMFAAYGLGQWSPAFFMRSHGMSLSSLGLWYGIASGLGGILGTAAGGFIARPLIRRDRRWEVWFPALSYLTAVPIYVFLYLTPSLQAALAGTFAGGIISALGLGTALASVQSVTPPQRRATAISIVMFAAAIVGLGGGPFVVGVLSDLGQAAFGADSLRVALVFSTLILVWASLHFYWAGRTFRGDAVN